MSGQVLRKIIEGFVCTALIPVMIFVTYGHNGGEPSFDRWVEAFQLGSLAAVVHLVFLATRQEPLNRIVLGGNIYLLAGGIAFISNQVWFLESLDHLQETGLMIAITIVGVLSTIFMQNGFIGVGSADKRGILIFSLCLLAVTVLALVVTMPFRGNPFVAGFLPIVGLIALQKVFALQLKSHDASTKE